MKSSDVVITLNRLKDTLVELLETPAEGDILSVALDQLVTFNLFQESFSTCTPYILHPDEVKDLDPGEDVEPIRKAAEDVFWGPILTYFRQRFAESDQERKDATLRRLRRFGAPLFSDFADALEK